jgi:ABC-type nitrate/sulfonate/bicarbonate transport system substrate-binding protein
MATIRLAYRDHDRTPVIYCIKAMAEEHYGVDVEVLHIHEKHAFERALLDGRCDTIIEHIEYLYAEAAQGLGVTFFCAPQIHRGLQLVVPADFTSVEQLRGKRMAVRDLGRPFAVTLWLRKMGLERDVETVIVTDKEIGRWQQWRKVVSGECAACFVAPIYLPPALAAGLKVFPVEEAEIVSNFAQACLSRFAADNPALMKNYMKAVIHAHALLLYRREEAVDISAGEPMRLMNVVDRAELRRQVDSIAEMLRVKPYPTAEAIVNTNAIAADEYGAQIENPVSLWDLHWVKELDDEGFIDRLGASLSVKG